MKRISILTFFTSFLIAACGGSEAPVAEQPVVAEPAAPTVVETPAPVEAPVEAPVADDAQPEMVEESAAEEEETQATDQPIILAQDELPAVTRDWKYEEGRHFARMVPAQPTVGGADKIEVAEIFWYGCNHCYTFEEFINRWKEDIPANVRFVRIPATWNPLVQLHARLYYTEEVLVNNGKIADPATFRNAVFAEYHRRGNRLASVESIEELFGKHGVSSADFNSTWNSFEVSQKLRVAQDLARRYSISSVPTMVVNGKYRTGAAEAGGYPQLLEMIDELVERETIR